MLPSQSGVNFLRKSQKLEKLIRIGFSTVRYRRSRNPTNNYSYRQSVTRIQVQFLSTKAEFFDPNAMQLHTACSTTFFRPASGT
jgi:hypothetical protein